MVKGMVSGLFVLCFVSCKTIVLGQDWMYQQWEPWGPCSVSCGGGWKWRFRDCVDWDYYWHHCWDVWQTEMCNTQSCGAVNGSWANWGSWGACSSTCGGGSRSRTRTCTNPPQSNGGNNCVGPDSQTQECATNTCPTTPTPTPTPTPITTTPTTPPIVHGNWANWSAWSACSATCGGGNQSRTRTCDNPAPANGGNNCVGSSSQTQECAANTCPTTPTPTPTPITTTPTTPPCQAGQTVTDRCGQRCICGAGGTLTQCTRIRKEFSSMTTAERELYIQVVKNASASTDPRFKSEYDRFITTHKTIFFGRGIHEQQHFLTWHRWYILAYENLLRRIDCRFTVAYWNWAAVAGNPWSTAASSVWYSGNSGFGGNGAGVDNCVNTGPFRQGTWRLVDPVLTPPDCLKREFTGNPEGTVEIGILLNIAPAEFSDFELALRGRFHDTVHCLIGGTMCEADSAAAPEFFLHHGYIDKIWADWQKRSAAHHNAFFPTVNAALPNTSNILPRQVLNNTALPGGVRVEYQEVQNRQLANVMRRLRSLSTPRLQMIPRIGASPISERTARLFRHSRAERNQLTRLEAMFQPRVRSRSSRRAGIAKDLGFDPKILNEMADNIM